jgi:predicted metal-dependent hydrolase
MFVIETIHTDNDKYDICVIAKKNARKLRLKFHPLKREFHLTVPVRLPKRQIQSFLTKNRRNIEEYAHTIPQTIRLTHGSIIPIFGIEHILQYFGDSL